MTRRGLIAAASIIPTAFLGGAGKAVAAGEGEEMAPGPAWRMPAEYGPHTRCWMAFPSHSGPWGESLPDVREAIAALARAVQGFEPVTVIVEPAEVAEAREMLGAGSQILPLSVDDFWTRDTLPTFLVDGNGGRATANWEFNVWGEKFPGYAKDRSLSTRLSAILGTPRFPAPIVTEGGALHVDGAGTLLVTETSVINDNRNPGLTKAEADDIFKGWLGVDRVVWLPGSHTETITDGHVDGFACFVGPGVVLAELPASDDAPDMREMRENLRALELARDAAGRTLEIGMLRRPGTVRSDGAAFCDCYVNFYLPNGGVVMPRFGDDAADRAAREIVARAFPDRRIAQIDIDAIAEGGGGIHCSTQQQPAA